MNDTRQALNELLVTQPDLVMRCLEELCEIDALKDLFGTLVVSEFITADQMNQTRQSLAKTINAMTILRSMVISAKQASTPHFYQGGLTNDSEAA